MQMEAVSKRWALSAEPRPLLTYVHKKNYQEWATSIEAIKSVKWFLCKFDEISGEMRTLEWKVKFHLRSEVFRINPANANKKSSRASLLIQFSNFQHLLKFIWNKNFITQQGIMFNINFYNVTLELISFHAALTSRAFLWDDVFLFYF